MKHSDGGDVMKSMEGNRKSVILEYIKNYVIMSYQKV